MLRERLSSGAAAPRWQQNISGVMRSLGCLWHVGSVEVSAIELAGDAVISTAVEVGAGLVTALLPFIEQLNQMVGRAGGNSGAAIFSFRAA